MYGVGGIPHTQWNGVEETVGGYPNGNWQPMYDSFLPIYNSMVGDDTPYEIDINGFIGETEVSYDVTVSMDVGMSNSSQKIVIFVVEDNIWSYWTGASAYHNARNVARDWLTTEDISISTAGETETFSGTFDLSIDWNSDSVKIIAIVQNYSSKQIYQVAAVNINDMDPDRKSLWHVIENAVITEGSVRAYSDDEFKNPLSQSKALESISSTDIDTVDGAGPRIYVNS